jgi:hypothetical protein
MLSQRTHYIELLWSPTSPILFPSGLASCHRLSARHRASTTFATLSSRNGCGFAALPPRLTCSGRRTSSVRPSRSRTMVPPLPATSSVCDAYGHFVQKSKYLNQDVTVPFHVRTCGQITSRNTHIIECRPNSGLIFAIIRRAVFHFIIFALKRKLTYKLVDLTRRDDSQAGRC